MDKQLQDAREDYQKGSLDKSLVLPDPVAQFKVWFKQYQELGLKDYNAMLLTTVRNDNSPASRIVLLKGISNKGFEFYTNYESAKGKEIAHNPKVGLTFFWQNLERQVRIEGEAKKMSAKESDRYFAERPRGSQIGAWVSPQSEKIEDRDFLEKRVEYFENKFNDQEVPRPAHWGGYCIIPKCVEFWQGRSSRLHDRLVYDLNENGGWDISRIAP